MKSKNIRFLFLILILSFFSSFVLFANDVAQEISLIVKGEAKIDKGLCLVVDIKDAKLVAEIAKSSQLFVQGCSWDSKIIQPSRQTLKAENLLERSSIIFIESDFLPYSDN